MKSVLVSVLIASLVGLLLGLGARGQSTVVQHKGDLLVGWGKVVTIENCNYQQEGDIYVEDGGTLVVRDATIRMQMDYDEQYVLRVRGEGKLEIANSRITGSYANSIQASDRGQATLSGVPGERLRLWVRGESSFTVSDSTIGMITLDDRARLDVRRSRIESEVRLHPHAEAPLTLSGLAPGHYDDFRLSGGSVAGPVPFQLTLEETDVGAWAVRIAEAGDDVTIENSQLAHIVMLLKDVSGRMEGLRAGLYQEWDSRALGLNRLPYRLRLRNTTLTEGWSPGVMNGGPIELVNCDIAVLSVTGETDLTFVDSTVLWLGVAGLQGSFSFIRSEIESFYEVEDTQAVWRGDVRFGIKRFGGGWHDSSIRRIYAVQVVDEQGRPVAGARVRVKDAWGSPPRDYIADGDGQVEIELGFTDKTCRSTWTLSLPGYATERAVTFFSATPLVLVQEPK